MRCQIDQQQDLKLSPDGTSWVFFAPEGRSIHFGDQVGVKVLTGEFIQQVVDQTNAFIAACERIAAEAGTEVYRLPVKMNHDTGGPDFGELLELRRATVEGKSGGWARVRWAQMIRGAVERRQVKYVSLGIPPESEALRTEDGTKFWPTLDELSLTSYPRLQSIGDIQSTLHVRMGRLVAGRPSLNSLGERLQEVCNAPRSLQAKLTDIVRS